MAGTGKWIAGGIVVLIGIFGLIAASRAADEAFYYGGFAVFIAAVVYVFLTISRHYDRMDASQAHNDDGTTVH